MKTVWVIWWLWPETTAEFYLNISFSCQRQQKDHRPGIVVASVPLPYAIESDAMNAHEGYERILPFLLEEARRLERTGIDFIVMPCNSLHIFIDQIRESVSIPVLSIIEETMKFLIEHNIWKVGVVSTSATIKNKLYEDAFETNHISYETPDAYQQAKMGKYIKNLVMWMQSSKDRDGLIEIIDDLTVKDLDCVILACTDLQLLIPEHKDVPIFDTMKILADATVKEMLS